VIRTSCPIWNASFISASNTLGCDEQELGRWAAPRRMSPADPSSLHALPDPFQDSNRIKTDG
jgi:hypothetical protein